VLKRERLTLNSTPVEITRPTPAKRVTFREFFYTQYPQIPPGQWGIAGEPNTETLARFMTAAADYLDKQ
jgi:hypothetical protein